MPIYLIEWTKTMNKNLHNTVSTVAVVLIVGTGSCATNPETVQVPDADLTCSQIKEEIDNLNLHLNQADATKQSATNAMDAIASQQNVAAGIVAANAAGTMTGAAVIPFIGPVIAAVIAINAGNQTQMQNRVDTLTKLYADKHCTRHKKKKN